MILGYINQAPNYQLNVKAPGPLKQDPGMFGIEIGKVQKQRHLLSLMLNDFRHQKTSHWLLGFNPYTGSNYEYNPVTGQATTVGFISQALMDRKDVLQNQLGGLLNWSADAF